MGRGKGQRNREGKKDRKCKLHELKDALSDKPKEAEKGKDKKPNLTYGRTPIKSESELKKIKEEIRKKFRP